MAACQHYQKLRPDTDVFNRDLYAVVNMISYKMMVIFPDAFMCAGVSVIFLQVTKVSKITSY